MEQDRGVAEQYRTEENLRIRIETHARYGVGESLEVAVDAAVGLQGREALLDVGTGPGEYPNRLFREGHQGRLEAVDSSPGMIQKAKSNGTDVRFVEADVRALPFADESFDVVTARHMLYHVPDVPGALAEVRRVLRPGGRLVAVTNASDYMAGFWEVVARAAGTDRAFERLLGMRGSQVFNEASGQRQMEQVFGNAKVIYQESALLFAESWPVVRYLDSCATLYGPADAKWQGLLDRVGEEVDRLVAQEPWRISKRVAIIRSTKGM